jgi:hypothetical protein
LWDGFVYDLREIQRGPKRYPAEAQAIDREFVEVKLLHFVAHLSETQMTWTARRYSGPPTC